MYLPHKHQVFMLFVKVTAPLIPAVSDCWGLLFFRGGWGGLFLLLGWGRGGGPE